jgi:subtilisin family serine protease
MLSSFRPLVLLAIALVAVFLVLAPGAQASASETYIVLYRAQASPANAQTTIQKAGGSLVANYSQIGVVIAVSSSASFAETLRKDSRVEGVSATAEFGVRVAPDFEDASGPPPGDLPNSPASDTDNLSGLQWDMVQIHAPEAHEITGGSPEILVGDIDTGLDFTHPDLAPNVDFANSASCVSGAPDTNPAAWDDDNGHGTHTAGTIAAASNGVGIVGVAPNVKIAGIKAGNTDGFFFPEAVVCSFMWAAARGIDVTNNSYFADPWLFNCRNDAEQRAIWKAEQRAIRYAMSKGVMVISSEGNENIDLSKRNVDTVSPDFPPGSAEEREVTNACVVIPVEIPGVVGVTANGNLMQKAYYSSYGVGTAEVVAPGGDRRFQMTAAAPNGRVLSTFPGAFFNPASPLMVQDCSVAPCATYAYLQGTSMAGPHAVGVAALIMSQFGKMSPGAVSARLEQTADPQPCPENPFNPGPPFDFEAICIGGPSYNGFYGHGQVNALSAVTHTTTAH